MKKIIEISNTPIFGAFAFTMSLVAAFALMAVPYMPHMLVEATVLIDKMNGLAADDVGLFFLIIGVAGLFILLFMAVMTRGTDESIPKAIFFLLSSHLVITLGLSAASFWFGILNGTPIQVVGHPNVYAEPSTIYGALFGSFITTAFFWRVFGVTWSVNSVFKTSFVFSGAMLIARVVVGYLAATYGATV